MNATCGSPLPGAVLGRSDWLRVESENKVLFSVITPVYKSYNDVWDVLHTYLVLEIHVMLRVQTELSHPAYLLVNPECDQV